MDPLLLQKVDLITFQRKDEGSDSATKRTHGQKMSLSGGSHRRRETNPPAPPRSWHPNSAPRVVMATLSAHAPLAPGPGLVKLIKAKRIAGPAEAGRADWAAGGGAGAWEGLLKGRAGTADGEGWGPRKSVSRRQRRSRAV